MTTFTRDRIYHARPMTRLLVTLAIVVLAGCPRSPSGPPAGDPEPPVSDPDPEPPGNTGGDPTQAGACRTDDDCVVSCARPTECCDQLCEPCEQVWPRSELEAHEAWRGGSCAGASCPVARCRAPVETTSARCEAGACVLVRTPL
jgi:hypothetical protein